MVKAFLRDKLPRKNPASLRERLAEKMILDAIGFENSAEDMESFVHMAAAALPQNTKIFNALSENLTRVKECYNFEVDKKKVVNKAADLVSVYKLLESKGLFKKLIHQKS